MIRQRGREVTGDDIRHLARSMNTLRDTLESLKRARAYKTAAKVRSAIKSCDGAMNNALRMGNRQLRGLPDYTPAQLDLYRAIVQVNQ